MKTNSVVFHSLGSIQRNGRAVLKAGGVGVDGHGGHHAQHHDNGQQRHKLVGFSCFFTSFLVKNDVSLYHNSPKKGQGTRKYFVGVNKWERQDLIYFNKSPGDKTIFRDLCNNKGQIPA